MVSRDFKLSSSGFQTSTTHSFAYPKVNFTFGWKMPTGADHESLKQEVTRLKAHLDSINKCTKEQCAEEFRNHVAGAREPFHTTHEETNPWTEANDKGCNSGGCVVM
jgi:hypothetical protein